jgi:hypothetical protein
LQLRYARYGIKKPQIKNRNKDLPPSLTVKMIYVKEEQPPKGVEGIEWFLMTNEEAESTGSAYTVNKLREKLALGAQGAGRNGRPLLLAHATRSAAEILFCRKAAKKIGAESPVFGAERQKCAHIFLTC